MRGSKCTLTAARPDYERAATEVSWEDAGGHRKGRAAKSARATLKAES